MICWLWTRRSVKYLKFISRSNLWDNKDLNWTKVMLCLWGVVDAVTSWEYNVDDHMMSYWCQDDVCVLSLFPGRSDGAVCRTGLLHLSVFPSQRSEGETPPIHTDTPANQSTAAGWHYHSCRHLKDLWHLHCELVNHRAWRHSHTHCNTVPGRRSDTEECVGGKLAAVYLEPSQQIPHSETNAHKHHGDVTLHSSTFPELLFPETSFR